MAPKVAAVMKNTTGIGVNNEQRSERHAEQGGVDQEAGLRRTDAHTVDPEAEEENQAQRTEHQHPHQWSGEERDADPGQHDAIWQARRCRCRIAGHGREIGEP
jgi:hypothetical protein